MLHHRRGEIELEGKQSSLWLVAEERFCTMCNSGGHTHNSACGGCDDKLYVYSGPAKIVNKTTGKFIVLNFITLKAGLYQPISTDSPNYKGYSRNQFDYSRLDFKDNVLAVKDNNGDIAPLVLAEMIQPEGVIDLFACKLATLAEKDDQLPIPRIVLPVLSIKELISKGLMAEPEGQIQLLSVA